MTTEQTKRVRRNPRKPSPRDITGMTFGMLTVLEQSKRREHKQTYWNCKCSCGNVVEVGRTKLIGGYTTSCGCVRRELGKITNYHGFGKWRTPTTSKFKGVSFYHPTKMWQVHIRVDGKTKNLGIYETEYEAATVYDAVAVALYGDLAMTNARLGLLQKNEKRMPKKFHLPKWL